MAELAGGGAGRGRRRPARRARRGRRAASSTPATPSAARSGCSCCSTRPTGSRRRSCSAPAPGSATSPRCGPDRIGQVGSSGTSVMVSASAERWFGPGFLDREPERGSALLHALRDARRRGLLPGLPGARGLRRARPALRDRTHRCWPWPAQHDVATPPERLPRDRRRGQGRPAGRARRRRPPRSGRGARAGRPADPRATSSVSTEPSDRRRSTTGMVVRREVLGDDARRPGDRGDHRVHPRLPGADHHLRLGHDLDPARPRPPQPVADHADRAGRPRPPRGARDAPARRPHQRAERRRDQGAAAPDRDLLRRARPPTPRSGSPSRSSLRRTNLTTSFVYAATRTPFGRFGGALAEVRPDDLAATPLTGRARARLPTSTRPRSATWCGATPTARGRTTATSAGWPCCSPGCRRRCPRRRSTGCAARAWTRR